MFLFSSPPSGFNTSYASPSVQISSDGLCAKQIDDDDLGGVLFLDNPLVFKDGLGYFQVRVEQTVDVDDDGLTLGVCLRMPTEALPGCADDVEESWSIGFNGCAHVDQAESMVQITWNPKDLKRGDNVGFLVTSDGAACIVVNGRRMANMPGLIPKDQPLYGFADLLGNTTGVSFLPDAEPPPALMRFQLQTVQDEAMEILCAGFSTNLPDEVQEPLMVARLLGVPESLIKSAQKALYKGPKVVVVKPKPRGAKQRMVAAFRMVLPSTKKAFAKAQDDADPAPTNASKKPEATRGVYGTVKKGRKGLSGKKAMIRMMVAAQAEQNRTEAEAPTAAAGPATESKTPGKAASPKAKEKAKAKSGGSITSVKSSAKPKRKPSKKGERSSNTAAATAAAAAAAAPAAADSAAADTAKADAGKAAIKAVQAALDAQDVAQASAALASAKAAGVNESSISRLQSDLADLEAKLKQQALIKDMDDALLSMNADAVTTALAAAKSGSVDAKEVARVEAALADMLANKEKTEKLKALGDAVAAKDIKSLQAALSTAKSAKIADSDLAPYQTALKELQDEEVRQAKIAAMDAAVKSGDIEKVRAALKEAQEAGVDSAKILQVEEELRKLEVEADRQAKKKALDEAIASSDPEKIKVALDAAQSSGVDAAVIAQGEQAIKEIELQNLRKQKVAAMDQALKDEDIEKTKTALAEAKDAGVDAAELKRGEEGLRKLEADAAKVLAASALREAMSSGKIDAIKAALADAKNMQVKPDILADGEKKLKELEKAFEEAKTKLAAAMDAAKKTNPPTVDVLKALKTASENAAACGVDTQEAEALHASLVEALAAAKKQAEEELASSVEGKDAATITEKIKKAQDFGSEEAVSVALERMGSLIEEDIKEAKALSREEKQEVLPKMEALLNVFRKFAPGNVVLRKLHNDMQDLKGALRVFCRIRPLNKRELAMNDVIVVDAKSSMDVTVTSSKGEDNAFSYDAIFVESNSQSDVFEECRSLIQSCFDGYNITIFTYGQTGAGKTWTLYGIPEQPGVSPRTCTEVFDVVEKFKDKLDCALSASMVELYNSNVRDLLSGEKTPPKLDIKQEKNSDGSMSVKLECTVVPAGSVDDLEAAVGKGFGNRKVASTSMNADSSRSHLLFMIFVKATDKASGKTREGKITIVDLAGSERLAKSQVTGDAQKEAIEINKSLTALGDVMMAITSKAKMVPYRNHKLTQLMQDSLGGSAKTLMFVNISPASNNADETINALKYASRARSIENDTTKGKKKKG